MMHAIDLATLAEEGAALDRAARAPTTLRQYHRFWFHFENWCRDAGGFQSLPAHPDTVGLYVVWLARRLLPSTISVHLAAISYMHVEAGYEPPSATNAVRRRMSGIRRSKPFVVRRKAPLTLDLLDHAIDDLGNTKHHLQRRALLLLGFAAALRRSELVGLNYGSDHGDGSGFVTFTADGLEVVIRKSKTDQEAKGVVIAIPFRKDHRRCPVRALRTWLDGADIRGGPIFRRILGGHNGEIGCRLRPAAVNSAVYWAAKRCGLPPENFGSHSLRAGYVTSASKAGASVSAIQATTRHRKVDTIFVYVRSVNRFRDSALNMMSGW